MFFRNRRIMFRLHIYIFMRKITKNDDYEVNKDKNFMNNLFDQFK